MQTRFSYNLRLSYRVHVIKTDSKNLSVVIIYFKFCEHFAIMLHKNDIFMKHLKYE